MAGTARLGVAGQSATISCNDAGEAVQITFVRPVSCKAGDSLRFDGCSSFDATTVFEIASVKGRRIVDVVPEHILDPSAATMLDSGVAVVSAAPAADKSSSADDATSTDGSDTEGSLVDFIEKDPSGSEEEEEEEEESDLDEEREAQRLVAEFPFDRALLEEQPAAAEAPLRRSRRARAAPTRYVDEKYETLMMEDVSDISSESSAEECMAASDDDDAEFESVDEASESEEESSDEDDEYR